MPRFRRRYSYSRYYKNSGCAVWVLAGGIILTSTLIVFGGRLNLPQVLTKFPSETEWCKENGALWDAIGIEERLPDGTRVDFLTRTHAIEVDWAKDLKWAEAVGQALYYARMTNKKPGIILLIKDGTLEQEKNQWKLVYRCMIAIGGNDPPIDIWTEKVYAHPVAGQIAD